MNESQRSQSTSSVTLVRPVTHLFSHIYNIIVITFVFSVSLSASSISKPKTPQEWNDIFIEMSVDQKTVIVDTFLKAREYDFGYSLAAIALKESYGGKYNYNINSTYSIDVGTFMINTKEYLRRSNRKVNKWNTARAMEELRDFNVNFMMAVSILDTCYKAANGNWRLTYQYYNGWKSGSTRSKNYSQDIINIIKMLKTYLRNVPSKH